MKECLYLYQSWEKVLFNVVRIDLDRVFQLMNELWTCFHVRHEIVYRILIEYLLEKHVKNVI